jgi:5S rRNA maturation endonuclease (ribonuclease M5)
MPHIIRNPNGNIIGLSDEDHDGTGEELSLSHPDVQAFLDAARNQLSSSDTETIRVIEDIVDVLIQKKVILLTDLPEAAQQKLSERQRMRSELNDLGNLMVDEADIL